MKLLITGATGYIGRFIVYHLSKIYGKENIDICARSRKKAEKVKDYVNEVIFADLVLDDISFLRSRFYSHVIMAHGKILGHTYRGIYLNNRKAIRNIIKNLNRGHLKQIIYLSSVAAGGFKDDMVDHDKKSQPENAYGIAKRKSEEILIRYGLAADVKIAILRPPPVYGNKSGSDFDHFIKGCKIGYVPYVCGRSYISLCSVDNLVHAIMCAIEQKGDGIYQVADDKRYTTQEAIDIIRKAFGLREIGIRGSFLRPVVNRLTKTVLKFNNFSFPYLFLLQLMHNPFYCNIEKIRKELSYKPKDTFDKYFTEDVAKSFF